MPDAPPPAIGEAFVEFWGDPTDRLTVAELLLGVLGPDGEHRWLVRAQDGDLWIVRVADPRLSPATRLWGTLHRSVP